MAAYKPTWPESQSRKSMNYIIVGDSPSGSPSKQGQLRDDREEVNPIDYSRNRLRNPALASPIFSWRVSSSEQSPYPTSFTGSGLNNVPSYTSWDSSSQAASAISGAITSGNLDPDPEEVDQQFKEMLAQHRPNTTEYLEILDCYLEWRAKYTAELCTLNDAMAGDFHQEDGGERDGSAPKIETAAGVMNNRARIVHGHRASPCPHQPCPAQPRSETDLERHINAVHIKDVRKYLSCPQPGCARKGFTRNDHLRAHLRNYHHLLDLPSAKRRQDNRVGTKQGLSDDFAAGPLGSTQLADSSSKPQHRHFDNVGLKGIDNPPRPDTLNNAPKLPDDRVWTEHSISTTALLAAQTVDQSEAPFPYRGLNNDKFSPDSSIGNPAVAQSIGTISTLDSGYGSAIGSVRGVPSSICHSSTAYSLADQSPPRVCQNCSTSITRLWQDDLYDIPLCMSCGLDLELYGVARPVVDVPGKTRLGTSGALSLVDRFPSRHNESLDPDLEPQTGRGLAPQERFCGGGLKIFSPANEVMSTSAPTTGSHNHAKETQENLNGREDREQINGAAKKEVQAFTKPFMVPEMQLPFRSCPVVDPSILGSIHSFSASDDTEALTESSETSCISSCTESGDVTGHSLDNVRASIVEQLMVEVRTVLSHHLETKCHTTGEKPPQSQSTSSRPCDTRDKIPGKRPLRDVEDKQEDGEDGELNGPESKRLKDEESSNNGPARKLACPFFQNDPQKHQEVRSCSGPGWLTCHRIKEHVYRCHKVPSFCNRCLSVFENETALAVHHRQETVCEIRVATIPHGITKDQEQQLRCKKKFQGSEEEKWKRMYNIIFPDDLEMFMPSPYYADVSSAIHSTYVLTNYDRYLARELPRMIRPRLEQIVLVEAEPIRSRVLGQVIDILRESQAELSRSFRMTAVENIPPIPNADPNHEIVSHPLPEESDLFGDIDISAWMQTPLLDLAQEDEFHLDMPYVEAVGASRSSNMTLFDSGYGTGDLDQADLLQEIVDEADGPSAKHSQKENRYLSGKNKPSSMQ